MTANLDPIFLLSPRNSSVSIATANANLDGTGTIGIVITAGSEGSRVHKIRIKAIVTTTPGMIRLYVHDGSAYFLWMEIPVSAITKSATVAAFETEIYLPGEQALILPSGYSLQASTEKAETFKITAEGGDW